VSKPKSSLWKDPGSRWGARRVEADPFPFFVLIKYATKDTDPRDLANAKTVCRWQRPANQGTALAADVAKEMGDNDKAEATRILESRTLTYAEVSAPAPVPDYPTIAAAMVRDLGYVDQP
jgi:crotonobetainyl-CoA:carnitine CoA-transferase CaiB-like acyl-CoA transferase